ncbi:amino acid adenylation domain-containing protein [Nocardia panacis]|uniref:amino acid adenylation domain-containing protein n=1 Tax=Nocardia panacis TaxID=2340916 RepID=UPI001EF14631|nr:amino acid adenylation domain-containing protein [Nocardia panacis]
MTGVDGGATRVGAGGVAVGAVVSRPQEQSDPAWHPLSAAQLRWWVAQQLAPAVPLTVAMYLDLCGPVDAELTRRCARQAARELGSPHLCFRVVDGQPRQRVAEAELPVRVVDLAQRPDPVATALAQMAADYGAPLDPVADILTVATVFRIGPEHHLLYLRSHHIALDGVGAAAVLRRIGELYRAEVEGESAPPAGALSVSELLADEAAYRSSPRAAADRDYWLEQLAGLGDPVGLAGDPALPRPHPLHVSGQLDEQTALALAGARARHGATFPELAAAAFACFLAAVSGSDEVVLSFPVTARPTAALRRSAGSLSNVVPLRLTGVRAATVGAVLGQVRTRVLGALRHQRYGYEDIQRDRGAHHVVRGVFGPVLNVLGFVEPLRLGTVSGAVHLLSLGPVEDLLINGYQLGPDERTVRLDFQANPARYRAEALAWRHGLFLSYFGRFLSAESDCPVRSLAEHAADAVVAKTDSTWLLPDLLVSGMSAENFAVQDGSRTLSYRELDDWSSSLARELIAADAGPGESVVVAIARSLESVVALWAVAKAGACFVPIDPADPPRRITAVIADSGARVGLTVCAAWPALPYVALRTGVAGEFAVDWLVVDDPAVHLRVRARATGLLVDADRTRPLRPDNSAYLIYTSGTTGAPKGVAVTHRGLGALTDHLVERYRVTADSVVLHTHSPAFDAHLLELLAAFAVGARLVVEPPSIMAGPELARLIGEHAVTHLLTTPAVLATLTPQDVPGLELVVVGGEACPAELVRRWAPYLRMCNGYGPTETTVMATQTEAMTPDGPVTIGHPLPGVRAVLFDSELRRAPLGARGELYLGGAGVAQGYHRSAALTAARFVADPAGTGERLYRTGDLVGSTAEGALEFLGRTDGQLAVRGRRIEPGEVEAALTALPEIAHAAVAVADGGRSEARLIGYVVVAQGCAVDHAATLRRLREVLPAAAVPAALLELDRLPMTANGKLDRAALPVPVARTRTYLPPESALEEMVAAEFARATEQARVGRDDDFFELGGNSLLGVTVSAELAAASGIPVTVRWLYTAPTVRDLAERIAAYDGTDSADDALGVLLPLRRGGIRPPLFCVHSAVPLAWCYAGLARHVTDRAVYGLQAPVLTDTAIASATLDDLAETYAREMIRVQPAGPYHLLGWSLGGQIAHAVAVRLRALGHEVALLAMLDSIVVPEGAEPPPSPRMRDLLTHLLGDEPEDADELPDLTADQAAAELVSAGASFGSGLTADQLTRLHRGYVDGVDLSYGYRPGVFDGDLLYFSATRGVTELFDARIWQPYVTGALIQHEVAATHAQLTNSEVVAVIGPLLAEHLAVLAARDEI